MKLVNSLVVLSLLLPFTALAARVDTSDVVVKLVSVDIVSGIVLVQTHPRPNISGLSCTNNFWLRLPHGDNGSNAALSILLTTKATEMKVIVTAEDNDGSEYCKLSRIVIQAN
jgi:hypothetical protein